jgi:transposase InsO family protein
LAFFATCDVEHIERVLTDNTRPYGKSFAGRQALADLGAAGKLTHTHRSQTNGKVERLHRTLPEEWTYQRPYTSDAERRATFDEWLDWCNPTEATPTGPVGGGVRGY